jgi:hypothetical protein
MNGMAEILCSVTARGEKHVCCGLRGEIMRFDCTS